MLIHTSCPKSSLSLLHEHEQHEQVESEQEKVGLKVEGMEGMEEAEEDDSDVESPSSMTTLEKKNDYQILSLMHHNTATHALLYVWNMLELQNTMLSAQ